MLLPRRGTRKARLRSLLVATGRFTPEPPPPTLYGGAIISEDDADGSSLNDRRAQLCAPGQVSSAPSLAATGLIIGGSTHEAQGLAARSLVLAHLDLLRLTLPKRRAGTTNALRG